MCGSAGTYIIGCERGFSNDNNILITKMTDLGGAKWSLPVKITQVRCNMLPASDSVVSPVPPTAISDR